MGDGRVDGLAESLEKELTCPICFNLFEEPKVLPCQHNFCGDCMEGLLQRNERVYKLECPICRDPFKREDIKSSFQMRRLVEVYHEQQDGTQSLPTPSRPFSQSDGANELKKLRSRTEVLTVRPNLPSISRRRPEPSRESVLYDNPATSTFYNQLVDSARKELLTLVDPLQYNHARILSALDTLEATKQDFQGKRDKDREKVKDYFGRLRNILDGREKNCLENLDEITTSALKMLGQQIHDLSDFESQLKSCNATLSGLLESQSKTKIVEMERRVTLCAKDLNKSVEQCTLNPVCTPNTNVLYTNLENFAKTCESLCYVYSVPHPPNCAVLFVTDDVISVTEPVTVSVDLRDIHSNPVMNQAENLEVSSDQGDNFIVSTTVREVSPGIYDLCYFPKVRIAHRLDVNHNNIYQEKTVIVSTDVRSLQVCNLDMNRQRTIDTFAGKRFSRPCGLALGPNDEIVISDRSLHQLIVFGSDLQFHQVIGHKGSGNGEFSWPCGLYIDEAGFMYVADRKNNRVQKLRLNDGTFVSKIGKKGTGNGEFREPRAVALSKKEHLYVADGLNHRVQVFSEEKFIFSFGRPGNGPCEFDVPASIAFNKSEDVIFVSDNGNHRIQVFTIHGEYIQMFGDSSSPQKIALPHGIHRSRDGHILISCAGSNDILVFKEDGTFVKAIKELIERPGEIAINSKGQIIATNHKGIVVSESSLEATPAET